MSRLIDADELIKYIKIWEIGTSISSDQKEFIDCVNKQPTAFDADKVVEQLEEQGLLVRLPVKIGDDIYKIPSKANYDLNVLNGYKANNRVYHQKVYSIVFSQRGWFVQCDKDSIHAPNVICLDVEYGKTWFLTREEAEKKLEEMKAND